MKKILLLLLALTIFGANELKAQNIFYNRVDVYNSNGLNATDFVFTYDRQYPCFNNIQVINNLNIRTTFNFRVYVNGTPFYVGYVNIASRGSVYFNDAFRHCSTVGTNIRISCW
jgi:hypothetical protein